MSLSWRSKSGGVWDVRSAVRWKWSSSMFPTVQSLRLKASWLCQWSTEYVRICCTIVFGCSWRIFVCELTRLPVSQLDLFHVKRVHILFELELLKYCYWSAFGSRSSVVDLSSALTGIVVRGCLPPSGGSWKKPSWRTSGRWLLPVGSGWILRAGDWYEAPWCGAEVPVLLYGELSHRCVITWAHS